MNKEPAMIVMLLVWAINRLVTGLNIEGSIDPQIIEGVATFIVAVGGAILIRMRVFTSNTIREAGLDPKLVTERAEDPSVPKFQEPKKA